MVRKQSAETNNQVNMWLLLLLWSLCVSGQVLKELESFVEFKNDFDFFDIILVSADGVETCVADPLCSRAFNSITERDKPFRLILDLEQFKQLLPKLGQGTLIIVCGFQSNPDWPGLFQSLNSSNLSRNMWMLALNGQNVSAESVHALIGPTMDEMTNIRLDSQIYVALTDFATYCRLFEVYRISWNSPLIVRNVLNEDWSSEYIWDRRKDLQGLRLQLSYALSDGYVARSRKPGVNSIKTEDQNGTVWYLRGKDVNAAIQMMKDMNYTADWQFEEVFGVYDPEKGSWNGVVQKLIEGSCNMSGMQMTITMSRAEVLTFTTPVVSVANKLFFKRPKQSTSWTTYLDTFNLEYWLCFSTFVIGLGIGISLFDLTMTEGGSSLKALMFGLTSVLLTCGSLSSDLGSGKRFYQLVSYKIWIFSTMVFGALNFYVYNAGLVSFLTVTKFTSPINGLSDILTLSGYQLIITSGTADVSYFSEATDENNPIAKQIWDTKMANHPEAFVKDTKEAEDRIVRTGTAAFFVFEDAYQTMEHYPCQVMMSMDSYSSFQWAYGMEEDSPLLKLINYRLNLMRQTGTWAASYHNSPKKSYSNLCSDSNQGFNPLGYQNIFSAFVALGLGLMVAILTMMAERWHHLQLQKKVDLQRRKTARDSFFCNSTTVRGVLGKKSSVYDYN